MIKLTILYPHSKQGKFDFDYYLHQHMPVAIEKLRPALRGVTVERGLSGVSPEMAPAYSAICHMYFDSQEAFLQAFLPHASLLQEDIRNYSNVEPVIQFSDVPIHQGPADFKS